MVDSNVEAGHSPKSSTEIIDRLPGRDLLDEADSYNTAPPNTTSNEAIVNQIKYASSPSSASSTHEDIIENPCVASNDDTSDTPNATPNAEPDCDTSSNAIPSSTLQLISMEIQQMEEPHPKESSMENSGSAVHFKPMPSNFISNRRRRSLLLAISCLSLASVLSAITTAFGASTYSQDLIHKTPFFPYNPSNAVLAIQLLATLSLTMIRESFLVCSEAFRLSLAARGTKFLNFIVLSQGTGFCSLVQLIVTKKGRLFSTWRVLALYKFFVLYIALTLAQFVWLLNIGQRTSYQVGTPFYLSRPFGGFSLSSDGSPFPFSRFDVFSFLEDRSQIMEMQPTICNPDTDFHCAAYAIYPYAGDTVFHNNNMDRDANYTQFSYIEYGVPIYILEFTSGTSLPLTLDDNQDPWAYCLNYTTPNLVSMQLCMGGQSRNSTESSHIINAGWQYCASSLNCTAVGNDAQYDWSNNVFTTKMVIQQANATVVSSLVNGTIVEITDTSSRMDYYIDIHDYFIAFTAPLLDIPVMFPQNIIDLLHTNFTCFPQLYQHGNISIVSSGTDRFVESLVFSMYTGFSSSAYPAAQLRGFLAYGLAANTFQSSCFGNENITTKVDTAIPTYSIALSVTAMAGFTGMSGFVIVACGLMLVFSRRLHSNIIMFPEISFATTIDSNMRSAMDGFSTGITTAYIQKFADLKIKTIDEPDEDGNMKMCLKVE